MKVKKNTILISAIISLLLLVSVSLSFVKAKKNANLFAEPVLEYYELESSNLQIGPILGPNNINLAWRFKYLYPYAWDVEFEIYFNMLGELITPTNPRDLSERINNPQHNNKLTKLPRARVKNLKTKLQQFKWPKHYIENAEFVTFDPGCFMSTDTTGSLSLWLENFSKEYLSNYGVNEVQIEEQKRSVAVNGHSFQIINETEEKKVIELLHNGELEQVENLTNEIAAPANFAMVNALLKELKSPYRLYALRDGVYFFGIFLTEEEQKEIKNKSVFMEYYQPYIPESALTIKSS